MALPTRNPANTAAYAYNQRLVTFQRLLTKEGLYGSAKQVSDKRIDVNKFYQTDMPNPTEKSTIKELWDFFIALKENEVDLEEDDD